MPKKSSPLPVCPKCAERPRAIFEPENPFSDGFYLFGCQCNEDLSSYVNGPGCYGYGPTPEAAEADWIDNNASETRLAFRINLRAIITVALILFFGSALCLWLWPSPAEIVGVTRDEFFTITMLFSMAVAAGAHAIHFLIERPAEVAAERRQSDVANLPQPPVRY